MQIYFSYNKKEVLQALRLHFIGRSEVRILIILVNVFAVFAAILLYFHKVSPLAFLLSSFLWIILMIAFWFFLPNSVYKRTSTFKDTFKMTFNEISIRIENDLGHSEWQWNALLNFIESPCFFHLYFNKQSFFLVPKSAVAQRSSIDELRSLLQEKIRQCEEN